MRVDHISRPFGLLLLCAALCLLAATPSLAGTSAPGVNLRWDQCYGDGGVWNKNFACDTNSGTDHMVASFELADDYPQVSGFTGNFDLAAETATLPAWWDFKNAGTCRQISLSMGFTAPGISAACPDWSNGQAAGGMGAYNVGNGPNKRRITFAIAVPQTALADLHGGQEYFLARLSINHSKTTGTGACAGCLTPVCIAFSGVIITTPTGTSQTDLRLFRGANYAGSQYVTWQNGYPLNIIHSCTAFSFPSLCSGPRTDFTCVLTTPTNSHGSTWGAVKALYR